MGYFTHWDANLYWCFLNMGLPVDLIRDWMVEIRGEHDKFTLEYYLDRSEWNRFYTKLTCLIKRATKRKLITSYYRSFH